MIAPELEAAKETTKEIARDIGDVLLYALYPTTGMRFLRYKYGLDTTIPDDWKPPHAPKTLEEAKKEDELIAKAKAGKLLEKVEEEATAKAPGFRTFKVLVDGKYHEVEVEETAGRVSVRNIAPSASRPAPAPSPRREATPEPVGEKKETHAVAPAAEGEVQLVAPVPGTVIRYEVNVGDRVKQGDTIVILEAMKMKNYLPAPVSGTVKSINCAADASVERGRVLATIAP